MNPGSRESFALGGRALELETTSSNATQTTSERLLAVSAHLFRTKGYAATTTREIASKLGLQKGSLYHHIEGKEDLLYRLCVDSLSRLHGAAQKAVDQEEGALAKINALILRHVVGMLADRDMHATMLIELRSLTGARRADVIRLRDQYEELIMGVISEGQREGTIRSDLDVRYLCLVRPAKGAHSWVIGRDPSHRVPTGSRAAR
jgi:AcrR family transcriptional regulator